MSVKKWGLAAVAVGVICLIARARCRHDEAPPQPKVWKTPEARTLNDGRETARKIAGAYAGFRNYEDRGFVFAWNPAAYADHATVTRFDTVFVRGTGLRFRYLDEQGRLRAAIWWQGHTITTWSAGVEDAETLGDAEEQIDGLIRAGRRIAGITEQTSLLVPALLTSRKALNEDALYLESAQAGCETCVRLLSGSQSEHVQNAIVADATTGLLYRLTVTMELDPEPGRSPATLENAISYEPRWNVPDSEDLAAKIAKRPW
jgi:hypothetical protein